jgi:hypothetical protein
MITSSHFSGALSLPNAPFLENLTKLHFSCSCIKAMMENPCYFSDIFRRLDKIEDLAIFGYKKNPSVPYSDSIIEPLVRLKKLRKLTLGIVPIGNIQLEFICRNLQMLQTLVVKMFSANEKTVGIVKELLPKLSCKRVYGIYCIFQSLPQTFVY